MIRTSFSMFGAGALLTAGALVTGANASPFDASLVAADAEWVVHVDVEAVLSSQIGGFMLEHADEFGAEMEHLEALEEQFGIDPFDAIYGVTVYGYDEPGEDPIVVIVGSDKIAGALDEATKQDGSPVRATNRGFSIDGELEIAVFEGQRGVAAYIVSEDDDMVSDGADVLAGRRSNLADAKWGKLRPVEGHGAMVMLSATGSMDDLANGHGHNMGPAGAFLDGAEGFSALIAEDGGQLHVVVSTTAADEKKASGLVEMANGLVSMARGFMQMQNGGDDFEEIKQFAGLLDGLNISADGRDVSLSISYDVDKIIDLIENADF